MRDFYRWTGLLICIFLCLSCQIGSKKELRIYNWVDYVDPELIQEFEKENKCRVVYDVFNNNEEMLENLKKNETQYDIVFPSGDHIPILVREKLIKPIDFKKLKHYVNMNELILQKANLYDMENKYSIPYFWGITGIIYNRKFLSDDEMTNVSWRIFSDKRFDGKKCFTMLDDLRDVIGVALILNGYGPNFLNEESAEKVKTIVQEWDKNVREYNSYHFEHLMRSEEIWLAQSYNGDAQQVINRNKTFAFALPKEGSTLWIDFMVLTKNVKNEALAYQFIDFLLEKENARRNAEYTCYATPNKQAFILLPDNIRKNEVIYPPESYLEKCYPLYNAESEYSHYMSLWKEVKTKK